MRNLKLVILLCGGALLTMMIMDGLNFGEATVDTLIMLAAFALPTVMGLLGTLKPPFQAWQAAMALAGFGVAAVRTKIWEQLPNFGDASGKGKAAMIVLVVGVVASLVAMLKPEDKA
jgi:hypothetical protein